MGLPEKITNYTYEDYLTWSDDERWEIIHGELYSMSPAPTPRHQRILIECGRQIANFLIDKPCQVYPAPIDVRLPSDSGLNDTVVQPDLSIICDPHKIDAQGCIGAPDVVFEILSPSTAVRDLQIKLSLYESHGVKEYWIIQPNDEIVQLYRLDTNGRYAKAQIFIQPQKIPSGVIEGLIIDLKALFAD